MPGHRYHHSSPMGVRPVVTCPAQPQSPLRCLERHETLRFANHDGSLSRRRRWALLLVFTAKLCLLTLRVVILRTITYRMLKLAG